MAMIMQDTFIEKLTLSSTDLAAINKLTFTELAEEDVFVFTAKAIDDNPTANGRIWSREWQTANLKNFINIPVLSNHENSQNVLIGRVFAAEQRENAIYVKCFVPQNAEIGREAKSDILASRMKSVSINADGQSKREGDLTRILPGENDRVYEISFVAVGGCRTCQVTAATEAAPAPKQCKGHCKCKQNNGESASANEWSEYARMIHADALNTYVRLAGLAIGEGFSHETYANAAKRLDPATLKTMSEDMRRVSVDRKTANEVGNSAAQTVKDTFDSIKRMKGN